MTPNEVDQFLEEFPFNYKKVFIYKQEFLPNEYITIIRDLNTKQFQLGDDNTTEVKGLVDSVTGFILQDELKRLLMKEELVQYTGSKWYMDIADLKTDGCSCGSWATSNPTLHSFNCVKWGKS